MTSAKKKENNNKNKPMLSRVRLATRPILYALSIASWSRFKVSQSCRAHLTMRKKGKDEKRSERKKTKKKKEKNRERGERASRERKKNSSFKRPPKKERVGAPFFRSKVKEQTRPFRYRTHDSALQSTSATDTRDVPGTSSAVSRSIRRAWRDDSLTNLALCAFFFCTPGLIKSPSTLFFLFLSSRRRRIEKRH